jgi:hypothetical protein
VPGRTLESELWNRLVLGLLGPTWALSSSLDLWKAFSFIHSFIHSSNSPRHYHQKCLVSQLISKILSLLISPQPVLDGYSVLPASQSASPTPCAQQYLDMSNVTQQTISSGSPEASIPVKEEPWPCQLPHSPPLATCCPISHLAHSVGAAEPTLPSSEPLPLTSAALDPSFPAQPPNRSQRAFSTKAEKVSVKGFVSPTVSVAILSTQRQS